MKAEVFQKLKSGETIYRGYLKIHKKHHKKLIKVMGKYYECYNNNKIVFYE